MKDKSRWPALMKLATAAEYLEMGQKSFRLLLARGAVKPVEIYKGQAHNLFRRSDLDEFLETLPTTKKHVVPGLDK